MTRKGPAKVVDNAFATDRLRLARGYLKAARMETATIQAGDLANRAMSQIVNAVIAYTDALTAQYEERVNRRDDAAAVKALRDALGRRLPNAQETQRRRILGEKDEIQYGAKPKTEAEAKRLLNLLEAFAAWAETELQRPR